MAFILLKLDYEVLDQIRQWIDCLELKMDAPE